MLVAAAFLLVLATPPNPSADPQKRGTPSRDEGIALQTVDVAPASLRLGRGVAGTMPKKARLLVLPHQRLLLLDLDGDGAIDSRGRDGVALEGFPFVVALTEPFLCDAGQCAITLDSKEESASLDAEDLGLDRPLVAAASAVNEVRIRAGLPLVFIDVELCRACEKHCDYLDRNGLAGRWQGGVMHFEDPKKPGFTEEGRAAGMGSSLYPAAVSYREAVWGWFATVWHGAPMLNPAVRRVGVALRHDVAMLYTPGFGEDVDAPVVHPADGAVGVPVAFGADGEEPSPVEGDPRQGAGSGFPIVVRLPSEWQSLKLVSFTLVDSRGRRVEGHASAPASPANPKRVPGNAGLAVFVPRRPLAAKELHRAQLRMEGKDAISWSFETAPR